MIRPATRLEIRLKDHTILATLMDTHGITVRELAAQTGVSHSTIGHLRSGKRTTTNPTVAKHISTLLKQPLTDLFFVKVFSVQEETAR